VCQQWLFMSTRIGDNAVCGLHARFGACFEKACGAFSGGRSLPQSTCLSLSEADSSRRTGTVVSVQVGVCEFCE
jgi:hypothetical protein